MTLPRRALLAALPAALAAALAARAAAQSQPAPTPAAAPARPRLPADSTTSHVLELPGRTLRFTATAGSLQLSDPQGTPQAALGFVAYRLETADPRRRPVTFALNGGPGSASAWLHLGLMGPWRLPFAPAIPSAAPLLLDNADTWLDFTDLVFLDPVGTGYSRFLAPGEDLRKQLWSVAGDIASLAAAMRRWLVQADRMASPKFLLGESYGGFRGPRLARALAESHGVGLSGLILVSPVLDFGGRSAAFEPLTWATLLPTLAAAARGATARVAEAEAYAAGEYVTDLLRGDTDTDAVARRSRRVAALTGLDPALVLRHAGRIDAATFLRDHQPGRLGSAYDLGVSMPDPVPTARFPGQPDPMTDAVAVPLTAAMLDLYTQRLGWRVDAPYELTNRTANRSWDYGGGRLAPESMAALRTALAFDPTLRVLVAHGLHDAVTPYFRTKLLLDTIAPGAGADRVALHTWPGGHMFYSDDAARAAFRATAAPLYQPP